MLNYIWSLMILAGFISGIFNGNLKEVTESVFDSGKLTVELSLSLIGIISLWSGIINIAEKSGSIEYLSKILNPIIRLIFPNLPKGHSAQNAITMNLIANFLGLGNAATPLGIKAMRELQDINRNKKVCSNEMSMFLIMNTSCLQLFPTTVIALRASLGSTNPSEIVYVVWLTSCITLLLGIILTKIFSKYWR